MGKLINESLESFIDDNPLDEGIKGNIAKTLAGLAIGGAMIFSAPKAQAQDDMYPEKTVKSNRQPGISSIVQKTISGIEALEKEINNVDITISKLFKLQYVAAISDKSKNEIYGLLKEWIANSYNDAKRVIELDDKENGKIILNGTSSSIINFKMLGSTQTYPTTFFHTIKLEIKDNKIRCTLNITDIKTQFGTVGTLSVIGQEGIFFKDFSGISKNKKGKYPKSVQREIMMQKQYVADLNSLKMNILSITPDLNKETDDDW